MRHIRNRSFNPWQKPKTSASSDGHSMSCGVHPDESPDDPKSIEGCDILWRNGCVLLTGMMFFFVFFSVICCFEIEWFMGWFPHQTKMDAQKRQVTLPHQYQTSYDWLVVSTLMKNMKVKWDDCSILLLLPLWKDKTCFKRPARWCLRFHHWFKNHQPVHPSHTPPSKSNPQRFSEFFWRRKDENGPRIEGIKIPRPLMVI